MGAALVATLLAGKMLIEPSGAAGIAAALRRDLPDLPTDRAPRIGVIVTGGNVDPALVCTLTRNHLEAFQSATAPGAAS